MMLGWGNRRGTKQVREIIWNKDAERNHVKENLGDQEEMELFISAQGM